MRWWQGLRPLRMTPAPMLALALLAPTSKAFDNGYLVGRLLGFLCGGAVLLLALIVPIVVLVAVLAKGKRPGP